MAYITVTSSSGTTYHIMPITFHQLREISNDYPGWNVSDLSLCWCILRNALYRNSKKPSMQGAMKLYQPTLVYLSQNFSIDSILEVMEDSDRTAIRTPQKLEELIMKELG